MPRHATRIAPPGAEAKSPIQVIERMMKLLDVLADYHDPVSLKQLALSTGLHPSTAHPEHAYDVQRFNSEAPGRMNLYNYVVMLGKGHEIAPMDPELGWRYVSRFRRLADGSLRMD